MRVDRFDEGIRGQPSPGLRGGDEIIQMNRVVKVGEMVAREEIRPDPLLGQQSKVFDQPAVAVDLPALAGVFEQIEDAGQSWKIYCNSWLIEIGRAHV